MFSVAEVQYVKVSRFFRFELHYFVISLQYREGVFS